MRTDSLYINNLSKSFDGIRLFDQAGVSLSKGTINLLSGSNGSGKTTLFNMICAHQRPDQGEIWFAGKNVNNSSAYEVAKRGMGRLWQSPVVFPNHSVLQNIMVSAAGHPGEHLLGCMTKPAQIRRTEKLAIYKPEDVANNILQQFHLTEKKDQLAGGITLGEKKLLGLAMMKMNNSVLLLLDEPFGNVDPATAHRISDILVYLRETGTTIFMIEHKLGLATPLCDHRFSISTKKIIQDY